MSIPKLVSIKEKIVTINPDFIDFNEYKNWSPERQIEVFWKLVKEYVYWNSDYSEQKIDKSMQVFNWAYGLVKFKFQDIKRNNWERYFDHIIRVTQYVIINSKKPSIKKTIIAMCHDLIEDTDISFSAVKEIFWTYIALWVNIITKKTIEEFIKDEKDLELFMSIKRSWILNSKWLIWDEYLQRKTYFPESITEEELYFEDEYKKLKRKYLENVNAEYFSRILWKQYNFLYDYDYIISDNTPCLNNFYNYALLISDNYWLNLTNDELKQVCFDALEVKFWDRIDNLRTAEVYEDLSEKNFEKAKRKINETKVYFYEIVKEYDAIMWTDFFSIILSETERLEKFISNKKVKNTLNEAKSSVWEILK